MRIKEIEKFLEKWPTWIGLIFLFIPGILYQIQIQKINLELFQGTFIIIFLILSLYYSLPFILIGVISFFSWGEYKPKKKIDEGSFLLISLLSIIGYSIITIFSKEYSANLWFVYTIWSFLVIITGIKNWQKIAKESKK